MTLGEDYTCAHGEAHPCPHGCAEPEAARTARLLSAVRSGDWLDAQDLPPVRWAVPGLIPEGLTLLVGTPKAGKSWLVLDALLAIAMAGRALGHIDVPPGPVLYMAMEDGDRRMRDRARHLLAGQPIPRGYHYVTGDRVQPGEIVATIRAWMDAHPDTRMVVIDTLGRVMPPARQGETQYERDYRIGAALKALAGEYPGLAVVVVHHTRKATASDYVDAVSGTHGLAGAADAVIILTRARDSDEGTISVTGRDVDEGTYALVGLPASPRLDGRTLAEAAARARSREQAAGLGDTQRRILSVVEAHPEGVTPVYVAAETGIPDSTVRQYLRRLLDAGRVSSPRRGYYVGVTSVTSVTSGRGPSMHSDSSDSSDTPPTRHLRLVSDEDSVTTVTSGRGPSMHSDSSDTSDTPPTRHLRLVRDEELEDAPLWPDYESLDGHYE